MAILEEALVCPEVSEEARPLFTRALWALLLGYLLYFVEDTSEGQQKTRALVNGSLEMIANLAPMLGSPLLGPIRKDVMRLLLEAGLMGETTGPGGSTSTERRS